MIFDCYKFLKNLVNPHFFPGNRWDCETYFMYRDNTANNKPTWGSRNTISKGVPKFANIVSPLATTSNDKSAVVATPDAILLLFSNLVMIAKTQWMVCAVAVSNETWQKTTYSGSNVCRVHLYRFPDIMASRVLLHFGSKFPSKKNTESENRWRRWQWRQTFERNIQASTTSGNERSRPI